MLCLNSLCVIKFRTLQMSWYTEVGMGGKEKDNLEVKRGRIKSHIRDMWRESQLAGDLTVNGVADLQGSEVVYNNTNDFGCLWAEGKLRIRRWKDGREDLGSKGALLSLPSLRAKHIASRPGAPVVPPLKSLCQKGTGWKNTGSLGTSMGFVASAVLVWNICGLFWKTLLSKGLSLKGQFLTGTVWLLKLSGAFLRKNWFHGGCEQHLAQILSFEFLQYEYCEKQSSLFKFSLPQGRHLEEQKLRCSW